MANDMQFFIISPIYIYLLYKKRVVGHLLVLVGIVTSFMTNGIISSKYDVTSLMFGYACCHYNNNELAKTLLF